MADSSDAALTDDIPLPTRRELRRIKDDAKARGEEPLTPDEAIRRAIAARTDELGSTGPAGSEPNAEERDTAGTVDSGSDNVVADAAVPEPLADGSAVDAEASASSTVPAAVQPVHETALDSTSAVAPELAVAPKLAVAPVLAVASEPAMAPEKTEASEHASAPEPVSVGMSASASTTSTSEESSIGLGPPTAGIPMGHGFVTPPPRRERRKQAAEQGDPKDYGKAGRNLPAAIGVGSVLGFSVLASLIFYPPSFVLIVLVGVGLAMWELANALSRSGAHVSRVPVIAATSCMIIATYLGGREALWVAFTAGAGAVLLFALLERRTANAVKDVCLSLFALTYVGLTASLIVYLLTLTSGNLLVICFLALVVASDIGGYIAGVFFGKHPIAPTISPKKSWEGFAGSALMSTVVGVCMAFWAFDAPIWTGIVLGVLIPAFATLGDFSESMIKRDLDLKDMGSLLPGHGGIMDRLDSILPTAPVVLILFSFLPGFVG